MFHKRQHFFPRHRGFRSSASWIFKIRSLASTVGAWKHLPENGWLPSGKHTKNDGRSSFFMGKLSICMAIFNSYVTK